MNAIQGIEDVISRYSHQISLPLDTRIQVLVTIVFSELIMLLIESDGEVR